MPPQKQNRQLSRLVDATVVVALIGLVGTLVTTLGGRDDSTPPTSGPTVAADPAPPEVKPDPARDVAPPPPKKTGINIRAANFGYGDKKCETDKLEGFLKRKCDGLFECAFKVDDQICPGTGTGGVENKRLVLTYDCNDSKQREVDEPANGSATLKCPAVP